VPPGYRGWAVNRPYCVAGCPGRAACYALVTMSELDSLTPEERAWVVRDEKLWRRAHEIASSLPSDGSLHVARNCS